MSNAKNGNGNGTKASNAKPPKVDAKQVKAMLLKVFAFRVSMAEKEEQLKVEARGSSDLLKAILDATNGHTGPYELDGRRYIIMRRTTPLKDANGKVVMTKDDDGKEVEATQVYYYLRSPQTEPEVVRL